MSVDRFEAEKKQKIEYLKKIGQEHFIPQIDLYPEEAQVKFFEQIDHLNKIYPGGMEEYVKRAKLLLKNSANDINPYEGFTPEVPRGEKVDFDDMENVFELERLGFDQLRYTGFILVAGGLGERLGYNGVKIGMPIDLITKQSFLEYYASFLKAYEKRFNMVCPLAIMTSDETHQLTAELLAKNNNFGLSHISILKQEQVPAMLDQQAHFAQIRNQLLIDTKPHGHGDIHTCLYHSGLMKKWYSELGKRWLIFFQDTNPLVFRAFPSVLGVSVRKNLEVNSVTVPKLPGDAVGAICKLTKKDGTQLTINVEYNQLQPLLNSTVGKEEVDEKGHSVYPGNINCLVFTLEEYIKTLDRTTGLISEFINPKYEDSTKNKFKSPTRLESMMQDYPKLLEDQSRVGFTQFPREYCFSPCKNDVKTAAAKQKQGNSEESAMSCENSFYHCNAEMLRLFGAKVEENKEIQIIHDTKVAFSPRIVLYPEFGVTLQEIKDNLKDSQIDITANSTLVIKTQVKIKRIILDGKAEIDQDQDGGIDIVKKGKHDIFKEINYEPSYVSSDLKVRGYDVFEE